MTDTLSPEMAMRRVIASWGDKTWGYAECEIRQVLALRDALDAERRRVAELEKDAMNAATDYQMLMGKYDAERSRVERLERVLRDAEPILEENFRWHRDAQSSPGKVAHARVVLDSARTALEDQT